MRTARVSAILEIFGNPQKSLNVIHVAGTNGKGSICSFLESILVESCGVCTKTNGFERDEEASKLKVGKFTSPHLLSVEDSLRINKVPISDKVLKGIRENVNSVAAGNGIVLTNFETLTITMFLWFKECGVDVAVVEVGLGGALDATNVMEKPLVCVFAPIGFDHEAILGTTIPEIAAHKAGILKKYGKAVIAQQTEISALESLVQTCEKEEVDYVLSGVARIKERTDFSNGSTLVVYTTKTLKVTYEIRHHLQGDFQHTNLACALDVIDVLNAKHSDLFNVTPNQVCSGVSNTAWPGRLQW
ncbi:folylpolyglutamate synthase, partial [Massospora cicadina]